MSVAEFLSGIDVFLFFVSWKREEAWARSAGEALMSGCPVITTAKGGNMDQVIQGQTGCLCENFDEIVESCSRFVEQPVLLESMRSNARRFAERFTSGAVAARFLEFLER